MSLITEREVIYHSSLGKDFPPSYVTDHLDITEENFMVEYFGQDFFDLLVGDLNTQEAVEPYDSDVTYSTGDKSLYEGRIFVSVLDDNIGQPVNEETWWAEDSKFDTDMYDEFWRKYLVKILARLISIPASTNATIKATKQGLITVSDVTTGFASASRASIGIWIDTTKSTTQELIKGMERWIKKQKLLDSYDDEFELINYSNVAKRYNSKRGKRRFHFRR